MYMRLAQYGDELTYPFKKCVGKICYETFRQIVMFLAFITITDSLIGCMLMKDIIYFVTVT